MFREQMILFIIVICVFWKKKLQGPGTKTLGPAIIWRQEAAEPFRWWCGSPVSHRLVLLIRRLKHWGLIAASI